MYRLRQILQDWRARERNYDCLRDVRQGQDGTGIPPNTRITSTTAMMAAIISGTIRRKNARAITAMAAITRSVRVEPEYGKKSTIATVGDNNTIAKRRKNNAHNTGFCVLLPLCKNVTRTVSRKPYPTNSDGLEKGTCKSFSLNRPSSHKGQQLCHPLRCCQIFQSFWSSVILPLQGIIFH